MIGRNRVVSRNQNIDSIYMLEHAYDRRLRLHDHGTRHPPQQGHIPDELQSVAEAITTPDKHPPSVERFSTPG
jgi:hypothetical protein